MPRRRRYATLKGLRSSGYEPRSVRTEIRANLARRIEAGEELFPGIVGYEGTALPEVENALLSGQDMIILGERGQAKSRLVRALTGLLDEVIPVVAGCEINDDPLRPVCRACKDRAASDGDRLRIDWLPRDERYGEKLATPDVTMAELLGDVDPIKVAEGRYLSDELTVHYGLIPRANRGIFCINELPDLPERIQVGLFSLMEERDVQIKGYNVRLPLDVIVIATANPEDYTNRGRIITPLKDRYGAQVRTHYPLSVREELVIAEQERARFADAEERVTVPDYMAEVIGRLTHQARRSPEINQRSGVSVRMTIANLETARSAAFRRSLKLGEPDAVSRLSDLSALVASSRGKIELETVEEGREVEVVENLLKRAVLDTFNHRFPADGTASVVAAFDKGAAVTVGPELPSADYVRAAAGVPALAPLLGKLGAANGSPGAVASAVEFVLEGLHLNRRLNRDESGGAATYRSRPAPVSPPLDEQLSSDRRRGRRPRRRE